ncbi:hypothetical protein JHK86_002879 [Glycine max]|nr:hypothetical protein JHK86_002879 [Glycine max]
MAHTSLFTPSSSLRFNPLLLTSTPSSSSSSRSNNLSFPALSRNLRKSVEDRKINKKSAVKAVYGDEFWTPERSSRPGIWSIRSDLQVPSSPYFPTYAQGQGPPPMVAERFQSVISQLFQYRIIRCGGAVDDDMANIIVAQLLYLDAVDPNKANEMLHHKANLNGYLAYHTGQSLDKINQDTDRDFFMSAKEAKEYGLIDGVIMNPLKALQPLEAAAEGKDRASRKEFNYA